MAIARRAAPWDPRPPSMGRAVWGRGLAEPAAALAAGQGAGVARVPDAGVPGRGGQQPAVTAGWRAFAGPPRGFLIRDCYRCAVARQEPKPGRGPTPPPLPLSRPTTGAFRMASAWCSGASSIWSLSPMWGAAGPLSPPSPMALTGSQLCRGRAGGPSWQRWGSGPGWPAAGAGRSAAQAAAVPGRAQGWRGHAEPRGRGLALPPASRPVAPCRGAARQPPAATGQSSRGRALVPAMAGGAGGGDGWEGAKWDPRCQLSGCRCLPRGGGEQGWGVPPEAAGAFPRAGDWGGGGAVLALSPRGGWGSRRPLGTRGDLPPQLRLGLSWAGGGMLQGGDDVAGGVMPQRGGCGGGMLQGDPDPCPAGGRAGSPQGQAPPVLCRVPPRPRGQTSHPQQCWREVRGGLLCLSPLCPLSRWAASAGRVGS